MINTSISSSAANRTPSTQPGTESPLADMAWLVTGSLVVTSVILALVITAMIRSINGDITMAWFISRGAGISAYLLITGSMIYGLMITTKSATSTVPVPVSYGMHEFISLIGLAFAVAHAVVLMWDGYIKYTPANILVPFNSDYRPLWVGIGQIAFYVGVLVSATFYAKKLMKPNVWRIVHYLSFAMFIMVTAHGLYSGTDTKVPAMQIVYVGSAGVVFFLTLFRMLTAKEAKRPGKTPVKASSQPPMMRATTKIPPAAATVPASRPAAQAAPAVRGSSTSRSSPAAPGSSTPPASSAVE